MDNRDGLRPSDNDRAVYIVIDSRDSERSRFYAEVDEADARRMKVIENILVGHYSYPIRVIAFDLTLGWAGDVTTEIASAVLSYARSEGRKLSQSAEFFVERVLGQNASMRAR